MVKLNKKAKKIIYIAIPLIIVLIVATILMSGKNKKRDTANHPNNETMLQEQANVYLLSDENVIVPLTIKYNQKDTLGENLLMVLSLIKENSPICNDTFQGVIPEQTKVNNLGLDGSKVLTIDFDEGFLEYNENHEVALLQTITWTMTEFEEVEAVTLTINEAPLLSLPRKHTPVANLLTREMGINHMLVTSTPDILGSTKILSYYTKTIDKKDYVIPVTQYVKNDKNVSLYDLTIQKLLEKPAITTRLKVVDCLKEVKLEKASELKDHILEVSLNEKALFDENTVQKNIYEMIFASMSLYAEVSDVSFVINENVTPVNGHKPDETFLVSSIVFNEYYI